MSDRVSRRGALRQLLQETTRSAEVIGREMAPILGREKSVQPEVGKRPRRARRTHPGRPSQGLVSTADLLSWAVASGLGEYVGAIGEAAKLSLRASPAQPDGGAGLSKIGGSPNLPPGTDWPTWRGEPLDFIAQFELPDAVGSHGRGGDLTGPGLMLIFCSAKDSTPLSRGEANFCRVIWNEDRDSFARQGELEDETGGGKPVLLTPELILPRVWSSGPRALGLSEDQQHKWEALRLRLARAQGVEAFDQIPGLLVLHRLFGYPDERTGDMPLICELLDSGIDLGTRPARTHPDAERLKSHTGRWRLLLQLSRSVETRSILRRQHDRLYLLIDEDRLRAKDFSNVHAVQR